MLLWLLSAAFADEYHVVRKDLSELSAETGVEARKILSANRLKTAPAGTIVRVPGVGESRSIRWISGAQGTVHVGRSTHSPRDNEALVGRSGVCTGSTGAATLRLATSDAGHDDLILAADTCVKVFAGSSRDGHRRSYVQLEEGRVWTRSSGGSGEVLLQAADTIVIGQDYRLQSDTHGQSVEVFAETTEIIVGGVARTLERRTGIRVPDRGRTGEATALMPAPRPLSPAQGETMVEASFSWEPVPGATGYVLELSRSRDFGEALAIVTVETPSWQPTQLDLPVADAYWWRVSALDEAKILGVHSVGVRISATK